MFAGTPYAHDALGTRPSFEKTTGAMLKQFHDTWYAPNNAILVITGNVDPQATLSEVKELFGDIAAKKLPPKPRRDAAPRAADLLQRRHRSARRHAHDRAAHARAARPGFRGPRGACGRTLQQALRALRARAAGQGDGRGVRPRPAAGSRGRLRRTLLHGRRRSGGARARGARDPHARGARGRAGGADRGGQGPGAQRGTVPAQLDPRARRRLVGCARALRAQSPDEDLARIERVTGADVARVAKKYLNLDHAITGIMRPRGSGAPVSAARGFGGQESISLGEAHPTELPSWAQKALERLEVPRLDAAPGRQPPRQRPHPHRADRERERHGERLRPYPQSPGDAGAAGRGRRRAGARPPARLRQRAPRPARLPAGTRRHRRARARRNGLLRAGAE